MTIAMQARAGPTAKAEPGAGEVKFSLVREPALFILAVLSLFAYSLFPRGYMPARTADGVTIVLCSAVGLETRAAGADGSGAPRRHIGSVTCDIAGSTGAAVLNAPPGWRALLPTLIESPLWPVTVARLVFRTSFDPNAPPTAPPLLKH